MSVPDVVLDVVRAPDLVEQPESERWLVEGLWADQAVGIIGGEPKACLCRARHKQARTKPLRGGV